MQARCRTVYVDPGILSYAVKLVAATRRPEKYGLADIGRYITFGASPRATIGLIEAGRALAFMRGRDYVLPEDVVDLVPEVLRHRLTLSYEALADGVGADDLVMTILKAIPAPDRPLASHVQLAPTQA